MSDPAAEAPGTVARLARRPLEHLSGVASGVLRALPRAIEDMFTDRCTQYAAAIAYRVLFSLFPLTIALVSIPSPRAVAVAPSASTLRRLRRAVCDFARRDR